MGWLKGFEVTPAYDGCWYTDLWLLTSQGDGSSGNGWTSLHAQRCVRVPVEVGDSNTEHASIEATRASKSAIWLAFYSNVNKVDRGSQSTRTHPGQ